MLRAARYGLAALLLTSVAVPALMACSSDDENGTTPGPTGDDDDDNTDGGRRTDGATDPTPTTTTTTEPPPPPPSKIDTSNVILTVEGVTRQYVLALPKTYDASRAYPLIVALHGDGGNARAFIADSGLDQAAGNDAVMAFTEQVLDLGAPEQQITLDQKFVKAVIDDVTSKQNIDASKIWGFGYSKGGYMLEEMQCKRQNNFTAFAAHAAGAPGPRDGNGNPSCPGAQAIPMFITQGSNDQGTGARFGADYWAGQAGCNGTLTDIQPAYCGAYGNCNTGTPVVYCEIPNQPHFPLYDKAGADSWAWFQTL